jgi:hypothetical protein
MKNLIKYGIIVITVCFLAAFSMVMNEQITRAEANDTITAIDRYNEILGGIINENDENRLVTIQDPSLKGNQNSSTSTENKTSNMSSILKN